MRPRAIASTGLTDDQRERLCDLLDAVDDEPAHDDLLLIRLLDTWKDVTLGLPFESRPVLPAYMCNDGAAGHWLVGDGARCVATIRAYVDGRRSGLAQG